MWRGILVWEMGIRLGRLILVCEMDLGMAMAGTPA
jgi:hypothetical protein